MRNHAKIFTFTLLSLLSISGIPMKKRTAFAQGEISKAECVMELNSRRVLYEERGDTRLPMASTTKIVTAATVLSQCKNIKEEVFIPKEAGRCLVSAASKNGMTLVCTVLHCGPMYERSAKLLNDAFSAYCYQPLVQKGEAFTVAQNKNGYSKEAFSYPLTSGEEDLLAYEVKEVEKCENLKNAEEIVGQLKIYLAKQLLFSTNLYKL